MTDRELVVARALFKAMYGRRPGVKDGALLHTFGPSARGVLAELDDLTPLGVL